MQETNKKNIILLSAAKVFAKYGFEKATIDDIIKKAKIAKGTVYYYFKSKEEIFNAIVNEGLNDFDKKTYEAIAVESSTMKKIEAFIETEKKYILKYKDIFIVFISEFIKKSRHFPQLEELIDQAKKENLIKKDVNTDFISNSIFWVIAMATINGQTEFQKEFILKCLLPR
jgi:AcrR family transcriptional regulator